MKELSLVFTDAIEQVNCSYQIDIVYVNVPSKLICFFQVKQQCEFKSPLEDKIRVMIRSNALKSPISTRLMPSVQMTSNKVLG